MNGVDLARFEFDFDTTWQAFFLDADLNIYSRYGGRDETSADGRLSKTSLLTTMREVLEIHERRRRQPSARDDDVHPAYGKATTPEDIPLLKANHQGCVHCHEVQEYRVLQAFYEKTFSRELLFGFPLPENIGIRIDRDHGHRIEAVVPDSPAARAGLAAGDVLTRVRNVPIRSEQDLRWALHRAPENDRPTVSVVRRTAGADDPVAFHARLDLPPHWRESDLAWRKSLRSVPVALGFLAYAVGREERRSGNLPDDKLAIKVVSIRGQGLAENVGLHKGDLIVSLDERDEPRTFDEFKSDLLRRFSPGDSVRLTVLREGALRTLEGRFPDWHTSQTQVP